MAKKMTEAEFRLRIVDLALNGRSETDAEFFRAVERLVEERHRQAIRDWIRPERNEA